MLRAPSAGRDISGGHPRASAETLLHIVDRREIHDVEVAGPLASHGQREGEHEEVILGLKDMVGLPDGCNAAAVLEPLLKLSDVHVTPDASVYRDSIFNLTAAEHHSVKLGSFHLECDSVGALVKVVVIVGGSASRFSMSLILTIASSSGSPGAVLKDMVIVTVGSPLTSSAAAGWRSTLTFA